MPRQLGFDLPAIPALGREDFFVSPSNATAAALIEGWQDWPAHKLALCGPQGAGKTHLTHVWAAQSGATILPAADLPRADISALAHTHVAVEDADTLAGRPEGERALLHLHNLVLAEGHCLLLTACSAPGFWPLRLPDLASRMQATPAALLEEPDDALLLAVMMKLFADRQLLPSPGTLAYLTRRMPRSFEMAHRIVSALDRASLVSGRPVTRSLAAQVLEDLGL